MVAVTSREGDAAIVPARLGWLAGTAGYENVSALKATPND